MYFEIKNINFILRKTSVKKEKRLLLVTVLYFLEQLLGENALIGAGSVVTKIFLQIYIMVWKSSSNEAAHEKNT
jgi:hypothetical protein